MSFLSIFFIAIGLSMDAFAVSITSGLTLKKNHLENAVKIGFFFGLFQALMPIIGWFGGSFFRIFIQTYNHWIAFLLLSFIGGKMIYESFQLEEDKRNTALNIYYILVLAVATSIDALAVGLSLSLINVSIYTPALIIGIITYIFSFAGVFIGNKFGHFFEGKIEILGGIILIAIGCKILIEHLI